MKAFCEWPFVRAKININGDVTMCCYQDTFIGNIFNQSLEKIWNCDEAVDVRNTTLQNKLHKKCLTWGGCPYLNTDLTDKEYTFSYTKRLPTEIEIDLPSRHCNIGGLNPSDKNPACLMCPRDSKKYRKSVSFNADHTQRIIEAVKPYMWNLTKLCILGVAEPFWKGIVFDILDYLEFQKYKDKILFWTFTNGSVFNKEVVNKFLEYTDRTEIYCSIDAGTKETYQKIRRRDFFELIKKNLIYYNSVRGMRNRLIINANINTINMHEMAQMVEFTAVVGADQLVMNPTHNCAGTMDDVVEQELLITRENMNVFESYFQQAQKRAQELGVNLHLYRTFQQVTSSLPILG